MKPKPLEASYTHTRSFTSFAAVFLLRPIHINIRDHGHPPRPPMGTTKPGATSFATVTAKTSSTGAAISQVPWNDAVKVPAKVRFIPRPQQASETTGGQEPKRRGIEEQRKEGSIELVNNDRQLSSPSILPRMLARD